MGKKHCGEAEPAKKNEGKQSPKGEKWVTGQSEIHANQSCFMIKCISNFAYMISHNQDDCSNKLHIC